MKPKSLKQHARLGLAALVLGLSASTLWAADDIIVGPTGSQSGVSGTAPDYEWQNMWGPAFVNITFDAANPPPTGDTTGAIYIQGNWPGTAADNFCIGSPGSWWGAMTFDGVLYASIEMDIKYDTTSTITPASAAHLQIGFDAGYNFQSLTNMSFNTASATVADGAWHHISVGIPLSAAGIGAVHSVGFYQWNPDGTTGTMNFWVANVQVIARNVPIAPPTTALTKAMPGLKQFANATPSYGRQDVRTDTNGAALVSWVGRTKPVVYSFTVTEFPTKTGFYCGLAIAPGDPASQTYADPDWSAANALWLNIAANGDGTQMVRFAYKTNQPYGNGMLYGAGVLTNFTYNGSALGTWSVTFTSDADATITAPDGSTYSGSIPNGNAALFADPCCFCLMSCPANDANIGQSMTFGALSLTGVGTPINQNFTTGSLNPLLVLQSQEYNWNTNPPNQFLLTTANSSYWNHWTLPDKGYSPVVKSNLTSGAWSDEAYSSILVNGSERWALVPPAGMPGASVGFFALIQRQFTQLQVLLPGQTNAPGTALGYTGTPTDISLTPAGTATTVRVNACDSQWHIIGSVTDTIHLTTTDSSAFLPNDLAMVNGTATFTGSDGIYFQTTGSQTVSALDMTSTTVTATATSAAVMIVP